MLEEPNAIALPDTGAMLANFVQQNPQLAWLPQMLAAQRQAAAAAAAIAEPQADECALLQQALAQAETRIERLVRSHRRLTGELTAAHELLSDLAAAFGACGLCWGEDPGCPSCRGRGKPGRFAADPQLAQRFGVIAEAPVAAARLAVSLGPTDRR
ncbi:hypothetical protein HLB44_01870 [Aquincola sp. S2]|uniref:Uncharacterized protein n=1 Tax=Pseudaquabacterium terrae TaxID=2732868 RepID=A0ABX2E9M4_9BURK|nr:hypothetical protein [Aquabacterium terrae]NRF65724.1 hypothetical protein [Aquabacterium terrae]